MTSPVELDIDHPDLTAFVLGEADGDRFDRALEFLIHSEEARAMAAETRNFSERLASVLSGEPSPRFSDAERTRLLGALRRQVWTRRLKQLALATTICVLTAAATLAGAAVLPETPASGDADATHATATNAAEGAVPTSAGLELDLPAADAERLYRLSLSSEAVQAAADKNWTFAFGPNGESTFGPVRPAGPQPGTAFGEQYGQGMAGGDVFRGDMASSLGTGGMGSRVIGRMQEESMYGVSGRAVRPSGMMLPAKTAEPAAALPPEVRALVEELRRREEQIRRQIEQQLHGEKWALLNRLRALQDDYTRAARLDEAIAVRSLVRALEAELLDVKQDPGYLTSWRGRVGETFHFRVTGNPAAGTVWGSDVYTDDSALAAAAVHAGVLRPGETGIVKVTILEGQPSYAASSRNGVTSSSYNEWRGSYRVERADLSHSSTPPSATTSAEEDPGNLSAYGPVTAGSSHLFRVTGTTDGSVWGSDVYTSDSDLSTAAVHAGLLKPGENGVVRATLADGRPSYTASERNGVASRAWGSWSVSYTLQRADTGAASVANHDKASVDGKYRSLLMTIDAPEDRQPYGDFRDFGLWEGSSYRGHSHPARAYWVYVAPTWYLWAETTAIDPTPTQPVPVDLLQLQNDPNLLLDSPALAPAAPITELPAGPPPATESPAAASTPAGPQQ